MATVETTNVCKIYFGTKAGDTITQSYDNPTDSETQAENAANFNAALNDSLSGIWYTDTAEDFTDSDNTIIKIHKVENIETTTRVDEVYSS